MADWWVKPGLLNPGDRETPQSITNAVGWGLGTPIATRLLAEKLFPNKERSPHKELYKSMGSILSALALERILLNRQALHDPDPMWGNASLVTMTSAIPILGNDVYRSLKMDDEAQKRNLALSLSPVRRGIRVGLMGNF